MRGGLTSRPRSYLLGDVSLGDCGGQHPVVVDNGVYSRINKRGFQGISRVDPWDGQQESGGRVMKAVNLTGHGTSLVVQDKGMARRGGMQYHSHFQKFLQVFD